MDNTNQPKKISGIKWLIFAVVFVTTMGILFALGINSVSIRPLELDVKPLSALAGFVLYLSMAFTLCPLPIYAVFPWIIQYFDPFTVAFCGACATAIANLHDYHIFHYIYSGNRPDV